VLLPRVVDQVQSFGLAMARLVDVALAIGHSAQVHVVGDKEIFVGQHGQIDFGAGDVGLVALVYRGQRIGRIVAAPHALVHFELHLAAGSGANDGLGVRPAYHPVR
jgi:hypothetical protein